MKNRSKINLKLSINLIDSNKITLIPNQKKNPFKSNKMNIIMINHRNRTPPN